jgi:DNA-binding response OmpR family regulator
MHASNDTALRVGLLEVRPDEYTALCAGRRLSLTGRELSLLTALARRAGRTVSRAELYEAAWGGVLRDGDRSVDVYVRKLRAKLSRVRPDVTFIETDFGFGYRLTVDESFDVSQLLHNAVTSA